MDAYVPFYKFDALKKVFFVIRFFLVSYFGFRCTVGDLGSYTITGRSYTVTGRSYTVTGDEKVYDTFVLKTKNP